MRMDPAEPAARQQTLDVEADLVQRNDLDGVHLDDYFYPYPVAAAPAASAAPSAALELDFPDLAAWTRYTEGGGTLTRADWRRAQVNQLIQALGRQVHQIKPWLLFGVSPFGLGRPERRAPGITGFSQYDRLYADAETWFASGWVDYLAPQLYWPIDQKPQAFATLLDSWAKENALARHLWPGLFTSRIDASSKSWPPQEILHQMTLVRQHPGSSGHLHFSMVALAQNRQGISDLLQSQAYAAPALIPASPWLAQDAPAAPTLQIQAGAKRLQIRPGAGSAVQCYAVWKRFDSGWRFDSQPAARDSVELSADPQWGPVRGVVVSAIGRTGGEGPRVAAPALP